MSISFVDLPYELRTQIYGYVFQREEGITRTKDDKRCFRHSQGRTFHERPRAYLHPTGESDQTRLFSTLPIGQVNRQIRADISNFLHGAPVDVVTTVHGFQYGHIIAFLKALTSTEIRKFTVRPEIESDRARQLSIELTSEYAQCQISDLNVWLVVIGTLLRDDEELSVATKLAPASLLNWFAKDRALINLLSDLYTRWKIQPEGPAKEELCKVLVTYWVRLRVEGLRIKGFMPSGNIDGLRHIHLGDGPYEEWLWYYLSR